MDEKYVIKIGELEDKLANENAKRLFQEKRARYWHTVACGLMSILGAAFGAILAAILLSN